MMCAFMCMCMPVCLFHKCTAIQAPYVHTSHYSRMHVCMCIFVSVTVCMYA